MSEKTLEGKIQELQQERDHLVMELQKASQLIRQAYAKGYTERKREDFVKDEDLKNRVAKGMEGIMLELRMQGCSNHISSFGGESSEKFHDWLRDIERNLALVGHDDARARALALQTLTGPAADFATREIKQNPEITWSDLKDKLDVRYNDMADLAFARRKLRQMTQARGESVQNYYERLMLNAAHAYGEEQLDESFVQLQLVEIFVDGLADDHMVRRLIRLRPSTLDVALRKALSEQETDRVFELKRGLGPVEEVNAVSFGQDPLRGEIEALCRLLGNGTKSPPLQISPVGSNEYVPQELRPRVVDASSPVMSHQQTQTPVDPGTPPQHQAYAPDPRRQFTCYECGGLNHFARDCPSRPTRRAPMGKRWRRKFSCYACGGANHFARDCRSRRSGRALRDQHPRPPEPHFSPPVIQSLQTVHTPFCDLSFHRKPVRTLVDTGADFSVTLNTRIIEHALIY